MSCLHRSQERQNFNSIGKLEIPEVALAEILQNALVHRSWLKPAPIRLLIFDNRVEIISPGSLHPTLTVEDIKMGNAYQRNQLMATLCSKTMEYRGIGSGIIRALKSDPNIDFINETSGDQFRVIFWRDSNGFCSSGAEIGMKTDSNDQIGEKISMKTDSNDQIGEKIGMKTDSNDQIGEKIGMKTDSNDQIGEKISMKTDHNDQKLGERIGMKTDPSKEIGKKAEMLLKQISENPKISINTLAKKSGIATSTVQIYLDKLRRSGKIRRIGPDKGGHWEVL